MENNQTNTTKNNLKKYLNSKSLQSIINESAVFINREHLGHSNPILLVQTIKQFIKLIRNIKEKFFSSKTKVNRDKKNSKIYSLRKEFRLNTSTQPIFLCAENNYTKELLQLAVKKTENYYKTVSVVQVGDQTRLVKVINLQRTVPLVIFVGNPTSSTIKFCLQHKIYVLGIFAKSTRFPLVGSYKVPMDTTTIRRCFWLILLLTLI